MSRTVLVRAGALAAVAGGLLRTAGSFAPGHGSEAARQLLYLSVDVFLLIGLLGFYELRYGDVGWSGALGFLLALLGLVGVRSSRAIPGVDLYSPSALVVAVGLVVLTVSAAMAKRLSRWVPATFLLSTLLGIVGAVTASGSTLFLVSGVIFGAAFIALGRDMWLAARKISS